jgi:hypothetical protein
MNLDQARQARYPACALCAKACREDMSVRYLRLPRLVEELARAAALRKKL